MGLWNKIKETIKNKMKTTKKIVTKKPNKPIQWAGVQKKNNGQD